MAITFNLERIDEVIKKTATEQKKWDFLATHTPFTKIDMYERGVDSSKSEVIDETFLLNNMLLSKRNEHQFIVIEGDPGTGKSHLIRWLKEKYSTEVDPNNEAILFIARYQNTLHGVLEQILESDAIPQEFSLNELDKIKKARASLSEEDLENRIIHFFALAVSNIPESEKFKPSELVGIRQFLLNDRVSTLLKGKNGPITRIKNRLAHDQTSSVHTEDPNFRESDFEGIHFEFVKKMRDDGADRNALRVAEYIATRNKDPKFLRKLIPFLNDQLEFVVRECTDLRREDLINIFYKLREVLKLKGKNLTLFMEDITSMAGIDKALLEVLITDHIGDNSKKFCRLISVIGVTRDYYIHFHDHIKERVSKRLLITEETFDEQNILEMTERYLNAIVTNPEYLEEWFNRGTADSELPITENEHRWSLFQCEKGHTFFLFPFNRNALMNLFLQLHDKTPRHLLHAIIRPICRICAQGEAFPPTHGNFLPDLQLPAWTEPLHEGEVINQNPQYGEQICSLLLLWGDGTAYRKKVADQETVGALGKEVFESFHLPFIRGVPVGQVPRLEPTTGVGPLTETKSDKGSKPVTTEGVGKLPDVESFNKMQKELHEWRDGGRLSTYEDLRSDIKNVLGENIDWQLEEIPAHFVSACIDGLSIQGQIGRPGRGFEIVRSAENYEALLALLAWRYLGKKSWHFKNSSSYLRTLHNWLLKIKDKVVRKAIAPVDLPEPSLWSPFKWSLLVDFYVRILCGNLKTSDDITPSNSDIALALLKEGLPFDNTDDNRSPKWTDLQKIILNKREMVRENHDLFIRYFNFYQGSYKRSRETNIFFIDFIPIMHAIEELHSIGFDLSKINTNISDSDLIWHIPLKLLKLIKDKFETAKNEELKYAKDLVTNIETIIGAPFTQDTVQKVFNEIDDFFHYLRTNLVPFERERFSGFNQSLTASDLWSKYESLNKLLSAESNFEQLLRIANNPLGNFWPYNIFFDDFMKLLLHLQKEYQVESVRSNQLEETIKKISDLFNGIARAISLAEEQI